MVQVLEPCSTVSHFYIISIIPVFQCFKYFLIECSITINAMFESAMFTDQ